MNNFDSIRWVFLWDAMALLGFPEKLIWWIKACVSTPMFSVSINGALQGYFPGKKGLRQGDLLSPYLFVICMEVLSRILHKLIAASDSFKYHWRCAKTSLSHICFADDLMLFCHGDIHSVEVLKKALDLFSSFSGLTPNLSKSDMFVAGVDEDCKDAIAARIGFRRGTLPLKYLGVPLLTSKLCAADCVDLENRILKRIKIWTNKFLSFSGRLQLLQSVLFSIQSYWCYHFILPAKVIKSIESKLRSFLWQGTSLSTKGAKVAWEVVTRPKKEGGLGIKKIKDWNRADMARYVWMICDPTSTSLWADWVHVNLLGRSQFWIAKIPWDCSWAWRKILQLRPLLKPYISYKVGNGRDISLWFDPWMLNGSICSSLDARVIYDSGLSKFAKVADIIVDGRWAWPGVNTFDLMEIRQAMSSMSLPNISLQDKVIWNSPHCSKFSIRAVWDVLREHHQEVGWYSVVWFKYHVPRHSFILWLAIHNKLPTHDRLRSYAIIQPSQCVLCESDSENHSHLFFQCSYTMRLWTTILQKLGLHCFALNWEDVIQWCQVHLSGTSLLHLLGRLCLAALVYSIWRERNARLHDQPSLDAVTLLKRVESLVRFRIMSCKPFAQTDANKHLVRLWSLPTSLLRS